MNELKPTEQLANQSKALQDRYEAETNGSALVAVVSHGQKLYASWGYQTWLESQVASATPPAGAEDAEAIVRAYIGECQCHESYRSRKLDDPSCPYHHAKGIAAAIEDYATHIAANAVEAERQRLTRLVDLIRERLDADWSFDEGQRHTHNWHSKQDFLQWLDEEIRSQINQTT